MDFREAAIAVLQDAGEPLHYSKFEGPLRKKGWRSSSKNVGATIRGSLSGDPEHFVRLGKGIYGLSSSRVQPSETGQASSSSPKAPPPAPDAEANPSFPDCAYRVLDELSANKPMPFRKVTEEAKTRGWLNTKGRTPHLSMYAAIKREVERDRGRGRRPRFIMAPGGLIALSKWERSTRNEQIEKHRNKVRRSVLDRLLQMKGEELEGLVRDLFLKIEDFKEVNLTDLNNDEGVDIRGILIFKGVLKIRLAVQVKGGEHNVRRPVVQNLRGSINANEHGLIVTTRGFTKGAENEAKKIQRKPIELMNGEALVDLLVEYGFGTKHSSNGVLEISGGKSLLDENDSGDNS